MNRFFENVNKGKLQLCSLIMAYSLLLLACFVLAVQGEPDISFRCAICGLIAYAIGAFIPLRKSDNPVAKTSRWFGDFQGRPAITIAVLLLLLMVSTFGDLRKSAFNYFNTTSANNASLVKLDQLRHRIATARQQLPIQKLPEFELEWINTELDQLLQEIGTSPNSEGRISELELIAVVLSEFESNGIQAARRRVVGYQPLYPSTRLFLADLAFLDGDLPTAIDEWKKVAANANSELRDSAIVRLSLYDAASRQLYESDIEQNLHAIRENSKHRQSQWFATELIARGIRSMETNNPLAARKDLVDAMETFDPTETRSYFHQAAFLQACYLEELVVSSGIGDKDKLLHVRLSTKIKDCFVSIRKQKRLNQLEMFVIATIRSCEHNMRDPTFLQQYEHLLLFFHQQISALSAENIVSLEVRDSLNLLIATSVQQRLLLSLQTESYSDSMELLGSLDLLNGILKSPGLQPGVVDAIKMDIATHGIAYLFNKLVKNEPITAGDLKLRNQCNDLLAEVRILTAKGKKALSDLRDLCEVLKVKTRPELEAQLKFADLAVQCTHVLSVAIPFESADRSDVKNTIR